MILGIIFDFDNTLYDYEYTNMMGLNLLFKSISLDHNVSINNIEKLYKNINKFIKQSNNSSSKFNKDIYIKKLLEELNISLEYLEKYINIYNDEFNNNLKIYDNVLELFILLKKNNIKIGILSNNIFIQQYKKLKVMNLLEYVDIIQTTDECGEEKPNIIPFLTIINKINLSRENIAYIGDNYEHDIIPSLNLKMLPFYFIKNSFFRIVNNYIEFGNYKELIIFFENYFKTINELIFLSKYFGQSVLNIQGPGGNISVKMYDLIFIKSSGAVLANVTYNEGYCIANNNKCNELLVNKQELELKNTKIFGYKIPSMETFFHSFMKKYTVHIHFTLSNIFLCSKNKMNLVNFKYNYEIIEYIPPGLLLAEKIKEKYSIETDIYFLANHGIIITNNNIEEIIVIYEYLYSYFNSLFDNKFIDEYNSFLINKNYYFNNSKSYVIRFLTYPYEIIEKIKYCFPDLAIFIENIKIIDDINDLYKDNKFYNIIILNKKVYLCAENLTRIYYLNELLDKYKILCDYSYDNLIKINDTHFLQNMEQEKYRKL
jgi:HAD superfamily hydrolase (TIGR01549 family)